jgi:hypothetical protein
MMDNLNLTPDQRRRKIYSELLSQQGQSIEATEPYGAIAKVGSQLLGAYLKSKSSQDEQFIENNRNKAYAAALKGDTSQVAQFDPKFALQLQDRADDKQYRNEMIDLKRQDVSRKSENPMSVREYEYYNNLTPEQKEEYLRVKRNPQIMNLGGEQAVYNPLGGGIKESFAVTPKPEQMPDFKASQAQAVAEGKAMGDIGVSLKSQEAKLPNLEKVVGELSELGQKATYTATGRLKDTIRRESGLDVGEGAVAREAYISMVNNQILPLLRDTFGAQFTEREGDSLKATLGSPNVSPKEKEAVLKSFIEQKKRNLEDLQKQYKPASVQFMGFE